MPSDWLVDVVKLTLSTHLMEVDVKFMPCTGECSEDGTHCEGCGRSFEEIDEMRELVGTLVAFAERMEYENFNDFADGVAATMKFAKTGEH